MAATHSRLLDWLTANGGTWNDDLDLRRGQHGLGGYALRPIPAGTSVVSCPFSLAITPRLARARLDEIFSPSFPPEARSDLSDRSLSATYLALHRLASSGPTTFARRVLTHFEYVASLPGPEDFRTPLWYNDAERQLLNGTNVLGAAADRLRDWKSEYEIINDALDDKRLTDLLDGSPSKTQSLSWESYLWGCSVLSSRAFPSKLIDGRANDSTPVLFPGVDSLNHQRGTTVSWISTKHTEMTGSPSSMQGEIQIVVESSTDQGHQVFNSYGAKSNEEFLLGYGFTIPSNPDDVVVLKVGSGPSTTPQSLSQSSRSPTPDADTILEHVHLTERRHYLRRDGVLPAALFAQMRVLLADEEERKAVWSKLRSSGEDAEKESTPSPDQDKTLEAHANVPTALDFIGWENEMYVLDSLEGMLDDRMGKLRMVVVDVDRPEEYEGVRREVLAHVAEYRRGQVEIVESALAYRQELTDKAMKGAAEAGIDMGDSDEEEEEGAEYDDDGGMDLSEH